MSATAQDPAAPLSTWHAGEVAMQRRVGAAGALADVGTRVVRDHLIEQHRAFFPLLPLIVLGAVDARGDAWATLRAGRPGFVRAVEETTLRIATARDTDDPADAGFTDGAAIAALGIDLGTRRRNRANGSVAHATAHGFDLDVVQSFGNCPKYIRLRDVSFAETPARSAAAPIETTTLDHAAALIVRDADTFFVASYVDREDGTRQVDVSHRGGRTGFVRIERDGTLTIPDFPGNRFFNTLGNLVVNPRAGLVFVDFATGDLLQLTGVATVDAGDGTPGAPAGAERVWRFAPRRVVRRPAALPLRTAPRPDGESPFARATGTWDDVTT